MEKNIIQPSQNSGGCNQQKFTEGRGINTSLETNVRTSLPLGIIDGCQLLDMKIEDIPKLYGFFPKVGLWFLIGASDTGKSMLLRQMALAITGGKPFLGYEFTGENKRVLYVSTEDDTNSIAYLVRKQNHSLGLTRDELANFFCLTDCGSVLDKIEEILSLFPVDLIILDAFGDLFNGKDLNQNNQVRQFLQPYSDIANKYQCSIGFLHHTGKRTEDLSPSKNNSIGSQAIEAKARFVAEFRQDRTDPNLRHFCAVKGNYLSGEEKTSSHVLRMDENLCFFPTGERVDFDNLKAGNNEGKSKQVHAKPSSYEDKTHIQFLKGIYKSIDTIYTGAKLKEQIRICFKCSDQPSRTFLEYYAGKGWIKNIAPSSSSSHKYVIIPEQIDIRF